jgi:hypothetical protein
MDLPHSVQPNPMQSCEPDGMEEAALRNAAKATDPDVQLKYLEIAKAAGERRRALLETRKLKFEARNASTEARFARTRFWASTITPVLALVVTGFTFVLTVRTQNRQFAATTRAQGDQFQKTADSQHEANEDSQWKDALAKVSFRDSESALVGALAMEGFFGKGRYQGQARSIAAASLPMVRNVAAFDQIVTVIEGLSTQENQFDLSEISQMISFAQRERLGMVGAATARGAKVPPFLKYDIVSIETDPTLISKKDQQRSKVAAWELDTVSHFLKVLWTDPKKNATPVGQNLTAVVLEDETFDNLDFSKANLRAAVLYAASFRKCKFRGANFRDALIQKVMLDGADLSEVTEVDGSVWQADANWWNAACVSPTLLEHLKRTDPSHHSETPKTTCP